MATARLARDAMSGTNYPAVDRVVKIVRELDLHRAFPARTEPKGPASSSKVSIPEPKRRSAPPPFANEDCAWRAGGGAAAEIAGPASAARGRNRNAAQAAGMSQFASRNGVPALVSWSGTGARGGRRRMRNRPGPQAVEIPRFRSQNGAAPFRFRLASPPPSLRMGSRTVGHDGVADSQEKPLNKRRIAWRRAPRRGAGWSANDATCRCSSRGSAWN